MNLDDESVQDLRIQVLALRGALDEILVKLDKAEVKASRVHQHREKEASIAKYLNAIDSRVIRKKVKSARV